MIEKFAVDERVVAVTTTIPVEVIFAAGLRPLDLNNAFISLPDPERAVAEAEMKGLPRSMCAWVKGLYATALRLGIRRIVGVVEGDCSNTHGLLELLAHVGVEIVPFAYPYGRDRELLAIQLDRFRAAFGVDEEAVSLQKQRLDRVRSIVHEIDRRTWLQGTVSGKENHIWTVSCSDFMGDPDVFEGKAAEFVEQTDTRPPRKAAVRLGYVGVPPICTDLYETLEALGADVVFNEMQRQFTMPTPTSTVLDQYFHYTYPYEVTFRIADIRREIRRRHVRGLIHYVQSFCYRQMHDSLIRDAVDVPVLTLECDRPGLLDAGARTRIEAFVEMIRQQQEGQ